MVDLADLAPALPSAQAFGYALLTDVDSKIVTERTSERTHQSATYQTITLAETKANTAAVYASLHRALTAESTAHVPAILFGTSLENQNGTGPDNTIAAADDRALTLSSRGWFNYANAYLGQQFRLVRNAGVGGNTYEQMRARISADVIAYSSDWVLMGGPVNDIAAGRSTALILADLDAMLDTIVNDGRRVLLLTAAPSSSYDTAAKRTVLDEVNAAIKARQGTRYGAVVVADAFTTIGDPTTKAPLTGMAIDSVHFSDIGAHRVGREAANAVRLVLPPRPRGTLLNPDQPQVVSNPLLTATGWTADASVAAVFRGDVAALTFSGITTNIENGLFFTETTGATKFVPGDTLQARVRVRWRNCAPIGVAGQFAPNLRITPRNIDGTFTDAAPTAFTTASAQQQVPVRVPRDGEMDIITQRVLLGANCDRLIVRLFFPGLASGLVEFSDLHVAKVN